MRIDRFSSKRMLNAENTSRIWRYSSSSCPIKNLLYEKRHKYSKNSVWQLFAQLQFSNSIQFDLIWFYWLKNKNGLSWFGCKLRFAFTKIDWITSIYIFQKDITNKLYSLRTDFTATIYINLHNSLYLFAIWFITNNSKDDHHNSQYIYTFYTFTNLPKLEKTSNFWSIVTL